MSVADRIAVMRARPDRAARHAGRGLRPARRRCSSPASSAPPTACPAWSRAGQNDQVRLRLAGGAEIAVPMQTAPRPRARPDAADRAAGAAGAARPSPRPGRFPVELGLCRAARRADHPRGACRRRHAPAPDRAAPRRHPPTSARRPCSALAARGPPRPVPPSPTRPRRTEHVPANHPPRRAAGRRRRAGRARPSRAAQRRGGSVTAAIYPGAWDEAFREHVAPPLKRQHNIDLEMQPLFAVDQIAKFAASRGAPPVRLLRAGPGPARDRGRARHVRALRRRAA